MDNNSDLAAEILVVDDSPFDAEIVIRQLEKAGYVGKTLWIKSGEEAIDFLLSMGVYAGRKKVNPKAIFLDLFLTGMSGFEVFQMLRMYDWTSSIPVIMLTSSDEEVDMIDSYNQGAFGYIVKPLNKDKLLHLLKELEKHSFL